MSDFATRWIATFAGVVIGLTLGLLYTWVIAPVELVNTYPALLRTDHRQSWVRLAALSYVVDGDLERTRSRLDGLKQDDVSGAIQALIEGSAAAGWPADTLRSLTTLAEALDVQTPAMLVYLYTPTPLPSVPINTPSSMPTRPATRTSTPRASPSPTVDTPEPTRMPPDASLLITPTPEPTSTPPSPTPTPPLLARLGLVRQEQLCEPGQMLQVQILVTDERGAGIPGVEVWLMWSGGADRAVTGLKPGKGAGYVDFEAEPSASYVLGVGELGTPLVTDLQVEPCPYEGDEEPLMGSWRVVLGPRPLATRESDDNG